MGLKSALKAQALEEERSSEWVPSTAVKRSTDWNRQAVVRAQYQNKIKDLERKISKLKGTINDLKFILEAERERYTAALSTLVPEFDPSFRQADMHVYAWYKHNNAVKFGCLDRIRVHARVILAVIENYYGVKFEDIKRTDRRKSIAIPRAMTYYLMTEMTHLSTTDIGRMLNRHHSSVLSGRKVILDLIEAGDTAAVRDATILKSRLL